MSAAVACRPTEKIAARGRDRRSFQRIAAVAKAANADIPRVSLKNQNVADTAAVAYKRSADPLASASRWAMRTAIVICTSKAGEPENPTSANATPRATASGARDLSD